MILEPDDLISFGQVPKWPNGAGCKPAAETLRRFESFPAHLGGNSSVGRASAFQAVGRGFESRFPLSLRSRCPRSSVGRARPW
jgi:hypothetical protein